MLVAQIGLGALTGALLAPLVFLAGCAVLLLLSLLTMLLFTAGIRAWNIHHDVAAPSFDRQSPSG